MKKVLLIVSLVAVSSASAMGGRFAQYGPRFAQNLRIARQELAEKFAQSQYGQRAAEGFRDFGQEFGKQVPTRAEALGYLTEVSGPMRAQLAEQFAVGRQHTGEALDTLAQKGRLAAEGFREFKPSREDVAVAGAFAVPTALMSGMGAATILRRNAQRANELMLAQQGDRQLDLAAEADNQLALIARADALTKAVNVQLVANREREKADLAEANKSYARRGLDFTGQQIRRIPGESYVEAAPGVIGSGIGSVYGIGRDYTGRALGATRSGLETGYGIGRDYTGRKLGELGSDIGSVYGISRDYTGRKLSELGSGIGSVYGIGRDYTGRALGATRSGLGTAYETTRSGLGTGYGAARSGLGTAYEATRSGLGTGYGIGRDYTGRALGATLSGLDTGAEFTTRQLRRIPGERYVEATPGALYSLGQSGLALAAAKEAAARRAIADATVAAGKGILTGTELAAARAEDLGDLLRRAGKSTSSSLGYRKPVILRGGGLYGQPLEGL